MIAVDTAFVLLGAGLRPRLRPCVAKLGRRARLVVLLGLVGCARPSAETSGAVPLASSAPVPAVQRSEPPRGATACAKDDDCVPAICCHADKCVPRGEAPACRGLMCTHLCMPHTIDCGGGCSCHAGQCTARLMDNGAP